MLLPVDPNQKNNYEKSENRFTGRLFIFELSCLFICTETKGNSTLHAGNVRIWGFCDSAETPPVEIQKVSRNQDVIWARETAF